MTNSLIKDKSFSFALKIIDLYKYLQSTKLEFIISKQLLRAGTSIGANVREALNAQSKKDFLSKMNIALKEADETNYWLELLIKSNILEYENIKLIFHESNELCKILNSIVKTTKIKYLYNDDK